MNIVMIFVANLPSIYIYYLHMKPFSLVRFNVHYYKVSYLLSSLRWFVQISSLHIQPRYWVQLWFGQGLCIR
jgi:hypothetical protein